MPRPTLAQTCWGTLAVVSATVVLLAVSGADSLLSITVLVVFSVALGTLATALSMTGQALRGSRSAETRVVRTGGPGRAARLPQRPAPATVEAEYAQQSTGAS
ncbi:hypothetical protein [Peterkaempfera griseoplana]|uniref:hypothetical protein n=1 Tax=Peterkaempfera griseoplana TaxID=66896 RepID=UPI0006E167DC|nr:hypothetical protein [Peterkaempfera griseoplana]